MLRERAQGDLEAPRSLLDGSQPLCLGLLLGAALRDSEHPQVSERAGRPAAHRWLSKLSSCRCTVLLMLRR